MRVYMYIYIYINIDICICMYDHLVTTPWTARIHLPPNFQSYVTIFAPHADLKSIA